jgi:serine protease Do
MTKASRSRNTFRKVGRSLVMLSAAFGLASGYILVFAPQKIESVTASMAAFGSKNGYQLPQSNGTVVPTDLSPAQFRAFSKIFTNIGKQTRPALVYIESKRFVESRRNPLEDFFFGFPGQGQGQGQGPGGRERGVQQGAGSGFIVDLKAGYVLTNNHVVEGSNELRVQTFDNRWFKAKVVGTHKDTDVAVIKLEEFSAKDLKQVSLANSDSVEVGDWVVALGAPFELPKTLTVGVVSALGRDGIMNEGSSIQDFIQTDAAINPGNSGGPLVDIDGRVVGINTAIYSPSRSNAGIGFAIPSNIVRTVAEQLINDGKVIRGYLGITMDAIPSSLGLPAGTEGVFVKSVQAKTPAEKAGLKPYDVIQAVDGNKISSPNELRRRIAFIKPNTDVSLSVLRDGKTNIIKARLDSYDEGIKLAQKEGKSDSTPQVLRSFGLALDSLNPEIRKELNAKTKTGVVVADVNPNSEAAQSFEKGDIILEVNRKNVHSPKELEKVFADSLAKEGDIVFLIERDGVNQLIVVRR